MLRYNNHHPVFDPFISLYHYAYDYRQCGGAQTCSGKTEGRRHIIAMPHAKAWRTSAVTNLYIHSLNSGLKNKKIYPLIPLGFGIFFRRFAFSLRMREALYVMLLSILRDSVSPAVNRSRTKVRVMSINRVCFFFFFFPSIYFSAKHCWTVTYRLPFTLKQTCCG